MNEIYELNYFKDPMVIDKYTTPIDYLYPIWRYFPQLIGLSECWRLITPQMQPGVKENYYYVSSYGRVCTYRGTFCEQFLTNAGYLRVNLLHDDLNSTRAHSVHRLVMKAFCPISNSDSYQVNHKDEIKTHNWVWNLEWMTGSENINYSIQSGVFKTESVKGLSEEDYNQIGYLLANTNMTRKEIAVLIGKGCTENTVHNICNGGTRPDIYFKYDIGNRRRFKNPASEEIIEISINALKTFIDNNPYCDKYNAKEKREIIRNILLSLNISPESNIGLVRYMEKMFYKFAIYDKLID